MAENATIDTNTDRMDQKDASPSHGQAVVGIEEDHGAGHGPEPTAFGLDAPAFVGLSMLVVIAIILWKKVPAAIGRALDRKIAGIRAQLDEAAQLRAEAEALRSEYEAKAAAADAERATMLERARGEAEAIVAQARTDSASLIERRTRMAEDKIAAAERQAIDEVRARAAAAAATAAAALISQEMGAEGDKAIVDRTIAGLGRTH
jgi:F-type H+-transporting ATPase subunit b